MNASGTVSQDVQDPLQDGWIPLAPVHLAFWLLLIADLLQGSLHAFLPYGFHTRMIAGWGFALLHWVLGGLAMGTALQERSRITPSLLRRAAFGLAAALLGLRICTSLASQFAFGTGAYASAAWTIAHGLFTVMGFVALLLLLLGRDQDGGGRFDAAVAALVLAGGLGWIGLPVLAIAAMKGHPLLAAQWQALRNPKEALAGGWFDGLDEGLRLGNLGACSLALAVAFLALVGHLLFSATHGAMGSLGSRSGWAFADILATLLASLLLAIHVLRAARRTGHREGRGAAIATLLIAGLLGLFLLAVIVFVVLILTDLIPFHLF